MCIFSQLFIVFPFLGHPVWLKHPLNKFIYVFGSKGSQKAPSQKENNYRRPTLLIEVKYVHFQPIMHCISIFGTPCMAKTPFEYVYLCIWIKRLPKGSSLEGKQLQESIFIDLGQHSIQKMHFRVPLYQIEKIKFGAP